MKKNVYVTAFVAAALSFGMLLGAGCSNASSTIVPEPTDTPDIYIPTEPETPSSAQKFVFGTAASDASATVVDSDVAYNDSVGYGFDGTVAVGTNAVTGSNFQFCVKVANANYNVTVVTSTTKVLSEVLPKTFSYIGADGNTASYTCTDATGIERTVTANQATTFPVAVCDGVMNLKFDGTDVSVSSVSYEPIVLEAREKPYLIALGDSTTENYTSGKQCSWGPAISKNLVTLPSEIGGFINCARSGADALSIYNGGVRSGGAYKGTRFGVTEALLEVHPGDYVTINIGINNRGDSRAAQIPVFENYVVNGVKQRGGIPVIATITPEGSDTAMYTEDTKVFADTYAGGKLYKAGATIPAGTYRNSRHTNQYNQNLLTIAANCGVPVIDLGMYGEQYLSDNNVPMSEFVADSDGYFTSQSKDSSAMPHHYAEKMGKVLANYVTKSVVEMINGTYVNPYSEERLEANAVTASADDSGNSGSTGEAEKASVPNGFTEIFKEDYSSTTAETCGWNGFVNSHTVARGSVGVTDGYVTLSGGVDGAKGVFFAPYADGKSALATVADGKDFYIAFDINFYANGNSKTGNSGASTLVLSNAAGYGLPIKGTTSSGDKANPQGGVRELANCLLLLQQKEVNGNVWKIFDSDTNTVTLNIMTWYTIALTRIDSTTKLTITDRASGTVAFDDYVENAAATKGGLGEIQLATKIAEGRTSFFFDNVIIGEGSNNGKVPGMKTLTHTVTFNANGGTFATSNPTQTVTVTKFEDETPTTEDWTKTLTTAASLGLQRASYDFAGWATSASATTATYTDGQSVAITSDMTLYAVWEYDDLTALLDIASVNTGTAPSFSKQIQIDTQDAAARDGIVNAEYDVDETALQAKLDEFDAENDVQPYIIARAKTKKDTSGAVTQKWVLIYGAAAGNKSGTQLTVPSSYNSANSFDVINYALSQLPANRSVKYKLLIDSDLYSGEPGTAKMSADAKISNLYAIIVPNYTILDFSNHTLYANNSDSSAIVPISMYSKHHVSLRNVTIDGPARYAIWAQGVDNAVFDTITFNGHDAGGVSLRIADRNISDWSTNVYVDNIIGEHCGNNVVETMKVDGIYVGKVTGTDCNDCALLFNTTTNGIVGTVRGTRCSPRSSGGVYAAFRCANYVGPNIHVHNVIANSCGRGFFSVSANHDITIDYLESNKSYKQAALIQDTQNLVIKSGKLTAEGRNTGGPAIEFGKDSKGGPLTVMNNVIKNMEITGYSKSVSASKSDYTTLINCTCSGSVSLGDGHSKVVASESELAVNTTAESVAITGTTIADSAYRGWTALKSVTIPASVTSIGAAAFMGCTDLESVTIEGACTIGDNAFYGCTSLKTLVINGNVTELGNCAFGNTQIESVVLPASVKKFGHTLFSPVTTSVTVKSTTIETMGTHAFFNLGDSSTITFTGAKPSDNELYHKDGNNASFGSWGAFWYGKTRSTINK